MEANAVLKRARGIEKRLKRHSEETYDCITFVRSIAQVGKANCDVVL